MFATVTPVALTMSPQSPGVFAVRKLTCVAPLQHCSPTVLVVVDDVLVVDEEVLLVVGVGADEELVELVEVLEVEAVDEVVPGTDVAVVELVLVLDVPPTELEVVELVLVLDVPPTELEVVELVLVVLVVPGMDVVVEMDDVVVGGLDVALVDELVLVLVDEVLLVVGVGGIVVVVPAPGSFSDGTQSSEALRHVPRNGFTSCSMNWSSTETVRGTNSVCPGASTTR